MLRNPLGGLLFIVIVYLSSFLGAIFIMGPSLPLLLWRPSWFRWINDRAIGFWLILPPAMLELLFGVKIVVTGETPPVDDTALIIMNHRSRLDWMFYWCFLHRYGRLKHEKIILKDDLKNIPGAGWAMQNAMFIFLKRRWEHDESYMKAILEYFNQVSYPLQLLIFPEGTNLDEFTKVKSDSFAKKNNLAPYEYVLHPRIKGFTFCVKRLRQGRLEAVHDVTVGYDVNHCFWEKDLIMGYFPRYMHFNIERYPIESLPKDEEELGNWCMERWQEKEKRLKEFYAIGGRFCSSEEVPDTNGKAEFQLKLALFLWVSFIILTSLGIYYMLVIRYYFYVMLVVYLVISLVFKGTDRLQLWSHNTFSKKSM